MTMSTYTYRDDSHPPPERQKMVLFCPECSHEGPLSDDWDVTTTGSDRLLVCPDCGTTVDRRSRSRSDLLEAT